MYDCSREHSHSLVTVTSEGTSTRESRQLRAEPSALSVCGRFFAGKQREEGLYLLKEHGVPLFGAIITKDTEKRRIAQLFTPCVATVDDALMQ